MRKYNEPLSDEEILFLAAQEQRNFQESAERMMRRSEEEMQIRNMQETQRTATEMTHMMMFQTMNGF